MYIGPERKKRRSSPIRVVLLLLLIGAGIYVIIMIQQRQIENPFEPTPLPTRSAQSYEDEARDWYVQGRLSKAIEAYEQAIALDPDNVLYYVPLVRLLALEGRVVEAVRLGKQAVEMAPESAQAWAALGMAYDWNGDVPEAIDACRTAIELDPTYAEAYAYLAEAYADAVRWTEALDAAETALQLNDRSVDVQRNYGYVLERQGDYTGAIAAYLRALEIHPNLAYIRISLGRIYRVLGDHESAAQHFQTVTEFDPENAEAHDELGWTYYGMGEYERAQTYLERATELDPGYAQAFGHLAINYWSRRNYEDAIPNFERAIALSCIEARRQATAFYITLEDPEGEAEGPSPDVVMHGEFVPTSPDSRDELQAVIAPRRGGEGWTGARGTVTLDARTGRYTIVLSGVPRPERGLVYVGWFEGINALSGDPLGSGPLRVRSDGSLEVELETGWVEGPRIEYFYTLGLAYFYMAECEKSYPLFDAALQIDPEDYSALEGVRLCQEAEAEED